MHPSPSLRLWFGAMVLAFVVLWSFFSPRRQTSSAPGANLITPPSPAIQLPSTAVPETKRMKCRELFQAACLRRGITSDPTGDVQPNVRGEIEALRLYEQIIHEHPDWTSDQVDEKLVRNIYTERRRKRMTEAYGWVVQEIKRVIDSQTNSVLSPSLKAKLKERIDSTSLELPPPASLYESEPDLFTKNEMYFESLESGRRVIRVGGAYLLTAKSWFNRVFTLAHELSHSIDPCELKAAKIEPASYRRLARCFYQNKIVKIEPDRLRCDQKNQLGEAFADWMATEVTARAMERYKEKLKTPEDNLHAAINSIRDLCDQEPWVAESETELYPDPTIRIGNIFAENPKIRAILNCEGTSDERPYCSF